jgi:signal transduction histidine kinase/DNA-binding LacI/PurR family transcriptional regulator
MIIPANGRIEANMGQSKELDASPKERLTLGFLTYHEDNDNHVKIMKGIFAAAQKHDINIVQFCGFGRRLGEAGLNQEIKALLQNIGRQDLDGLMFVGWIPNFGVGFQADINQLQMPLFSIGAGYENIPNVHTDGGIYLRELFTHLIQVHGCKRIAFVSPAISSTLHDNRIQAYMEVMNQFGLYEPELFVTAEEIHFADSDFYYRGRAAVKVLLEERKITFDAIFSSYSEETTSILNELKKRGFNVPRNIKVVGYEDEDSNKYASVPVTTFHFPFWELGFYGCQQFINILKHKNDVPFSEFVPGKIVYRTSCGCISDAVRLAADPIHFQDTSHSGGLNQDQVKEAMTRSLPNAVFDIEKLLQAFFKDFQMKTKGFFFQALEEEVITYYQYHADGAGLENFISELRKLILPALTVAMGTQLQPDFMWVEALFHQARIIVEESLTNLLGRERVEKDYLNQMLHKISHELITTFNTQKLMNVLETSLPQIEIPGCYIFLSHQEQNSLNDTTLVFYYADQKRDPAPNMAFSQQDLFANLAKQHRFSLMAYPLSVKNEYLGLVFFEPGPMDERIYFTLSVLLSTALKEALLVERLENTNRELKAAQEELVDKAHKAGMADIATGTLHNIGNVLNSINTSIHVMKDIVRESPFNDFERANQILIERMEDLENFICHDPRGKKLLQFYLKLEQPFHELRNLLSEHLERLVERINLVNEIIIAQQDYAGVKGIAEEVDITDIIKVALKLLSAMLQKYKITLVTQFQPVPKIFLQRTKVLHILVNLFNNARDAMIRTPDSQKILTIALCQNEDTVQIRITDTGQGIAPELLKSIFAQGFTTKPEGHGFGLHSCANYMAEMGGRIWAESPGPGQGATFVLEFAIKS